MSSRATPNRYVISVLVADRVGILRDITSAITDMRANIDGISQTVVAGHFTVILAATFEEPQSAEAIRDRVQENFQPGEASIVVRPHVERPLPRNQTGSRRYIVTLTGRDRPGILKRVTAFLAQKGINIEDWFVEFEGPNVTHIGEITVPRLLDIKQIQDEFRDALTPMGLVAGIQHENIFRATNEVGGVRPLLAEDADAAHL
jgi:glycine cleavage system transcriptional repressor